MRIFLLKILKKPKIVFIESLDRLILKQNEILLLFGSDEMLDKYKYENLSKNDQLRVDSNPNLDNKNEFKISRALIFEFEKNYIHLNTQTIYKSISHSANHAILAISLTRVGVDLECVKNRNFYPCLDFCFSDYEKHQVQNAANPLNEFYKIWTYKEAMIKLFNLGFYALDKMKENTSSHFSNTLYSGKLKFIYSVAYITF
ncbi:4'-phosphopantetheinyl transferase superfamily protein [Helicobacter sp. MIT 99-5507]|uniref:4'-phosphopantetheinyl transferase family protein n=1 Tax=Helicobacter sp. MIT 99-5507 TaxID=152489 RepID=UPI000E1E6221|nr:4'-phosphopantetheinyl transferase superfamily protein [Helicobacter sp. MIT 99-5507]RDU56709.1 hypothetical protein CQA42_07840 [Helicobacter sp. MIT 99-5507]